MYRRERIFAELAGVSVWWAPARMLLLRGPVFRKTLAVMQTDIAELIANGQPLELSGDIHGP